MRGSWAWVLVSVGFMACGGGKKGASTAADATPASGETERERIARRATEKREQCESVGNAIQAGETGGTEFVNLNDAAKLKSLSEQRSATAEKIASMEVTADGLVEVVADYVKLNRDMVEALGSMRSASGDAEQKAGLDRYRQLEGEVDGIFERFNQTCDGR